MPNEVQPTSIGYDQTAGPDEAAIAHLHAVTYGTGILIVEMEKPSRRAIEELQEEITIHFDAIHPRSFFREVFEESRKPLPWKIFTWNPLPVAPRRTQQRSANMRKHARIVRSRMMTSEHRQNEAHWAHWKRRMNDIGIVNPNASDLWRDLF